jgi:hypothetical protein
MVQATTWATPYRVPDTLHSDTEESIVGTQWHQEAISALTDMLEEVARRRGATWGVCNQIALLGLQHEIVMVHRPPDENGGGARYGNGTTVRTHEGRGLPGAASPRTRLT